IEGVALSTAAWFNGEKFLTPIEGTIEHKKFLNDDLGPATGCSLNVVWFYEDYPEIAKELHFKALESFLRASRAIPGLYDINSLVGKDGNVYFLEFTPRFGYDSEPSAQQLLLMDLGDFWYYLTAGMLPESPFDTSRTAYSVRLTVPPYPTEEGLKLEGKGSSVGTGILGISSLWEKNFVAYGIRESKQGLEVATPSGLVGLGIATGISIKEQHEEVMKYLKSTLQIPNIQYRTDGFDTITKDLEFLSHTPFKVKGLH
ncbi:MAG: hypothetical protein ACREQ5_25640, partial [Candidatus Dormibacteria bacterium]